MMALARILKCFAMTVVCLSPSVAMSAEVTGRVVDAASGSPIPSRIYIQDAQGKWFFPESASPAGSAVKYQKKNWNNPRSVEMHTTLSAHPFRVKLPAGTYTVTVERGKEYSPLVKTCRIVKGTKPSEKEWTFRLRRWINMASRGWYSGDTHVHRTMAELPNVMAAEDLNVSFPLLYWVHNAFVPPSQGDRSTRSDVRGAPVAVDPTHVIYPMNTEYEIFHIKGKPHTLGAFFVINHKTPFEMGGPPLSPILKQARREGGLIELDKHAWPWSMALVPILDVDLYELSNNHVWRTEFGFWKFGEKPPAYMQVETDERGLTELGWIQYGFENYYTLLNCGFRLRPTAGTASGVHPVPLGFGRVYVHLGDTFSYEAWMDGLNAGRSFVTTGPMLFAEVNGRKPGHVFTGEAKVEGAFRLTASVMNADPVTSLEVVVNGQVRKTFKPQQQRTRQGASQATCAETFSFQESSWLAVRCYSKTPEGRIRFAHTAPFYVDIPGKPLRPRRAEVAFLVRRTEEQIQRSKGVIPETAIAEYRKALAVYKKILKTAQ